jgi:dTDP-4-amino-4,6-dideoxygalactose transaminase
MKTGCLKKIFQNLSADFSFMIPYGKQSIDDSDLQAVAEALKSDFLTTGPLVARFENEIENVTGAPSVVVSSGTAALHAAYAAIGVQQGDEVITPPITFVATQATAALLGAKIVFADVLPDTYNINPALVEEAITPRTKAIVAVDYAGHPADLKELKEIAVRNGIYLIEDAAHSINSKYRGTPVGSIADLTTFSFFPTKNVTSGEGGAISSNNLELLDRARKFSRQGLVRESDKFEIKGEGDWHQEVHEFGLNYRLPDVLCALGISQIKRIDKFKLRRREIHKLYREGLEDIADLQLPTERAYVESNWHLFPLLTPPDRRREVFDKLRTQGIGVQVNYIPAYRHPAFRSYKIERKQFPVSEDFYSREISLPLFADLTDAEVHFIIGSIRDIF